MLMLENTNCNRDDENSNQKEGSAKRCALTMREEEMDDMDSNTSCDSDSITLFTTSSHKHGQKRPHDASETVENWTAVTARKHLPAACKNPASVAKRNARERRRIKNVNVAFDELRQHVPLGEQNKKKISKVDTLQSAIEYIKALEKLVKRKREFETSSEESGKDDTDMTGYTPRSNSLDDENCSMFSHSGATGTSLNPENWYPGTDRRPRNSATNSTDVEPISRRSEDGQSWQTENTVDANRRDNDSGYSDCSLLVGSMDPVSPSQNGSFAPDSISAFAPYAPLLREVSPDDVETLLDNTSTDVDAPRTRSYYTDYGFISSVVPIGSQRVSYSTPLPPPPNPSLVCALTSNDCGNHLSHESNSMARIGANMSEYTDSNEGYRFGDAYA